MLWRNLGEDAIKEEGFYLLYTYFAPLGQSHRISLAYLYFTDDYKKLINAIWVKRDFFIHNNPYKDVLHPWHHPDFHRSVDVDYFSACPTINDTNEIYYLKIPVLGLLNNLISEKNNREIINPNKRLQILKRDKFKCQICGTSPAINEDVILCIDHIHPLALGGSNHINNLQTLCISCNSKKGIKESFKD